MRTLCLVVLLSSVGVAGCREKETAIAAEREVVVVKVERPQREHYLGMAVPEHEPVPFLAPLP